MPREAANLMEVLKDAESGKAQQQNGDGLEYVEPSSIDQLDLNEGVSPCMGYKAAQDDSAEIKRGSLWSGHSVGGFEVAANSGYGRPGLGQRGSRCYQSQENVFWLQHPSHPIFLSCICCTRGLDFDAGAPGPASASTAVQERRIERFSLFECGRWGVPVNATSSSFKPVPFTCFDGRIGCG
jgi:hypothetical protein